MNAIRFIFVINLTQIAILQASFLENLDLIENYFKHKSIKHASIYGCFNKTDQITLGKILMQRTQQISVVNINNLKPRVYEKLKTNHQHIGIVLDGECPKTSEFLISCSQLNFFDVKHQWLITFSSENFSKIFENITLNINADVHAAVKKPMGLNWTIIDVYNPASKHGGALNATQIGHYNVKEGYNVDNSRPKYWKRKNMNTVTFKTLVVGVMDSYIIPPFNSLHSLCDHGYNKNSTKCSSYRMLITAGNKLLGYRVKDLRATKCWLSLPVPFEGTLDQYLSSDDDRDINTFNRFHSRLIYFCRDYYNFTLDIGVTKSWGYTNPDGTFDGMVGALERKLIDFGSSPLFVREDRARVMDYGRNTWVLKAGFIFRNPKARTSIKIFLKPLSTSIWIITGFLAILSIILLKKVTAFEKKKYRYNVEASWSLSVIFTVGAFCQQGLPSTPRMTCGRITFISLFLLSIMIYQFYSASLVSHLLMKPLTTIKNIQDLLDSPLKAGCEDILYNRDYFKRTTDSVARKLYQKKILGKTENTSNFLPPEKGLRLVEQGGYAFHVETATAYPIIEKTFAEKAICELKEVQLFRTQPMHANFQKHSPFRDMIDTCLQRIAETGLLYRERRHWHPRKPECIQSSKTTSFNVSLNEFYPALVVLLIGIFASLGILLVEVKVKMMVNRNPAHPPIFVVSKPLPFVN